MKLLSTLTASAASIALFAINPAYAQEAQAEAAPTAVAEAEAGAPALWKVADEDTTIYLFGTVHTLPDNVDWYSGSIKEALNSSGSLVTEIDMTPEATASMGSLVQSKGMLTDGQTLRGLMNEEQKATFEAGLEKIGVPAATFDPMEPWLASIAILQIVTQASGFDASKGVEAVLEATVKEGTKRVALETVEFQISVFDELPVEQQLLYLLEGAENPTEAITMLNTLIEVWARGDVEELGAMMNEGFLAHPNLADRLLYQRNANWADWIDTRLEAPGTVFIAVGAGHLAGEKSVQDYLAERDIGVTRVQ